MPLGAARLDGELAQRSRAAPLLQLQALRRLAAGQLADGLANLVCHGASHVDAADGPLVKLLDAFTDFGARAALGAVLHDAVVLACGRHDATTLEDIVCARLLAVDILPGLTGP